MQLTIGAGPLEVDASDGVIRARGIPYGSATRFDAAVPPTPWTTPRDATVPGPACPQRPGRLDFVTGPVLTGSTFDEDCLVLSVTAPGDATGLPVMVWFHGGAYVAGGGESSKYDPTLLAVQGGVVVVTVTYRLGIFGYLAPPDADGADNVGLRDQILALRWVRDNAAAFGGDPANVTVFGQSAGGDSVIALMLSDETEGLFRRAIVQSAPLGIASGSADVVEGRGRMSDAMRAAMGRTLAGEDPRAATPTRLLAAEGAAVLAARDFGLLGGMAFAPTLGLASLPSASDLPERIADAARRVELLIGHTRDDASPFVAMNPRVAALGRLKPLQRRVIRAATGPMTSRVFGRAVEAFVASWRSGGGRAATYRFDWAPPDAPFGACHCIELPYLLGSPGAWADAPMLGPTRSLDDHLGSRMRALWSGFARDGLESLPSSSLRLG